MKNIILLLLFCIIINYTQSYEIIIDYNTNNIYNNYSCGDRYIYPPCNNFYDAGERARQLLVNNSNSDNTNLTFMVVKYNKTIKEPKCLGWVDYFDNIKLMIIDNNGDIINYSNNQNYGIEIDGSELIYNFVRFTTVNKKDENKNQIIEIGSGFRFINFNDYTVFAKSTLLESSIIINGVHFYNSSDVMGFYDYNFLSLDEYKIDSVTFNNCIFENMKVISTFFQVRKLTVSNCKFIKFFGFFIIQSSTKSLNVLNCSFENNQLENWSSFFITKNIDGDVNISNCKFINNTISIFITGGDEYKRSSLHISLINSTFNDNYFYRLNKYYPDLTFYFITLAQMNDGYSIYFKDVVIERPDHKDNQDPGGFISSNIGSGIYTLDNLKINNYNFNYFLDISNCEVNYIDTPDYEIQGSNNSIKVIQTNNNINNSDNNIILPTILPIGCFVIIFVLIIVLIKKEIINIKELKKISKINKNKNNKNSNNNDNNTDIINNNISYSEMNITDNMNNSSTDNITIVSDTLSNVTLDDKGSAIAENN